MTHWTEEQYANHLRQKQKLKIDDPIVIVKQPEKVSKLERRFEQQLIDAGITGYQRNYFFLPNREYELDFAFVPVKVYVEVQGMAHRIKAKFTADIEKRVLARFAGWRGLEVDGVTIKDGRALEWLRRLLA